jgi:hypothetical protein
VKEANLKRIHIEWFQLQVILKKGKRMEKVISRCQRLETKEEMGKVQHSKLGRGQ